MIPEQGWDLDVGFDGMSNSQTRDGTFRYNGKVVSYSEYCKHFADYYKDKLEECCPNCGYGSEYYKEQIEHWEKEANDNRD